MTGTLPQWFVSKLVGFSNMTGLLQYAQYGPFSALQFIFDLSLHCIFVLSLHFIFVLSLHFIFFLSLHFIFVLSLHFLFVLSPVKTVSFTQGGWCVHTRCMNFSINNLIGFNMEEIALTLILTISLRNDESQTSNIRSFHYVFLSLIG